LELQAALTGRKKPVLGQKKAANNFFDADHHFETHKIGFKDFDQQWDVPKRGLEPVKQCGQFFLAIVSWFSKNNKKALGTFNYGIKLS
jgi:hypothetical protein